MGNAELQKLLKAGLRHSDPDKLASIVANMKNGARNGAEVTPEQIKFMQAFSQMEDDSKRITDRLEALEGSLYTEEEKEELMEAIEELVNQVDNACNMIKFGFGPILRYARQTENSQLQWRALWVLASCAQNNTEIQNFFREEGLLAEWMKVLISASPGDISETVLGKYIGLLSATVRDNAPSIKMFLDANTMEHIFKFFVDEVDSSATAESVQSLSSEGLPLPAPHTVRPGTLNRSLFFIRHLILVERDTNLSSRGVAVPEGPGGVDLNTMAPEATYSALDATLTPKQAADAAARDVEQDRIAKVIAASNSAYTSSPSVSNSNESNESNEEPPSNEPSVATSASSSASSTPMLGLSAPPATTTTTTAAAATSSSVAPVGVPTASDGSQGIPIGVWPRPVAGKRDPVIEPLTHGTLPTEVKGRVSAWSPEVVASPADVGMAENAVTSAVRASPVVGLVLRSLKVAPLDEDGCGVDDRGYDDDTKELAEGCSTLLTDMASLGL